MAAAEAEAPSWRSSWSSGSAAEPSFAYPWTAAEEALAKERSDKETTRVRLQQAWQACREYEEEVEELKNRIKTMEHEMKRPACKSAYRSIAEDAEDALADANEEIKDLKRQLALVQ